VRAVQQHVKQSEFYLAQGLHAALEIARCQHFLEQGARQGLAAVYMRGHVADHIPLPAKVFHELTWQFHRIPLHAADTGHIALAHLREQMVQAVAAFVEQGDHIVMRKQGWLFHAIDRAA
jgi:hypothetical protein